MVKATIKPRKLADFRGRLPRLADLHDRFRTDLPNNFFRTFSLWFDESEVTLRFYQQIERDLSFVPPSEWNAFAAKVGAVVNRCDQESRRDWEKLFDVFSEALGARVLVEKYDCDVVRLVSNSGAKTCDWFGAASGQAHYLEVKTVNHSDAERRSWHDEAELVHTSRVPAALLAKARISYEKAKRQLDAMPGSAAARKLVLFVIHADHNFDPFESSVRELLQLEFARFEDPSYSMLLAVNTPNDR